VFTTVTELTKKLTTDAIQCVKKQHLKNYATIIHEEYPDPCGFSDKIPSLLPNNSATAGKPPIYSRELSNS